MGGGNQTGIEKKRKDNEWKNENAKESLQSSTPFTSSSLPHNSELISQIFHFMHNTKCLPPPSTTVSLLDSNSPYKSSSSFFGHHIIPSLHHHVVQASDPLSKSQSSSSLIVESSPLILPSSYKNLDANDRSTLDLLWYIPDLQIDVTFPKDGQVFNRARGQYILDNNLIISLSVNLTPFFLPPVTDFSSTNYNKALIDWDTFLNESGGGQILYVCLSFVTSEELLASSQSKNQNTSPSDEEVTCSPISSLTQSQLSLPPLKSLIPERWHTLKVFISFKDQKGLGWEDRLLHYRLGGCQYRDFLVRFYVTDKEDAEECESGCFNRKKNELVHRKEEVPSAIKATPLSETNQQHVHFVTAASGDYVDRLANLIGSIQYWHSLHASSGPSITFSIHVYNIGIPQVFLKMIKSWTGVILHDIDWDKNSLPEHFKKPALVAYKAWCILDVWRIVHAQQSSKMLHSKNPTIVLWIDANTEVRRPLTPVLDIIRSKGYFFTISGHLFPTWRTVRSKTMNFLGCKIKTETSSSSALFNECTSAIMGFLLPPNLSPFADQTQDYPPHLLLLIKMDACAKNLSECHYPTGSDFSNQKRDQSGMNAAICSINNSILQSSSLSDDSSGENELLSCHSDEIYWAYSSQDTLTTTIDPTHMNDIVFYSRRGVGTQGYIQYLQPEAPRIVNNDEGGRKKEIDVHGGLNDYH